MKRRRKARQLTDQATRRDWENRRRVAAELALAGYADLAADGDELDADLKEARDRYAKPLIDGYVKQTALTAQNRTNARRPRPGGRNQLRPKIIEAMRAARRRGMEYEVYMESWDNEEQNGLLLDPVDAEHYRIADEHDATVTYKTSTLRTLWKSAKP